MRFDHKSSKKPPPPIKCLFSLTFHLTYGIYITYIKYIYPLAFSTRRVLTANCTVVKTLPLFMRLVILGCQGFSSSFRRTSILVSVQRWGHMWRGLWRGSVIRPNGGAKVGVRHFFWLLLLQAVFKLVVFVFWKMFWMLVFPAFYVVCAASFIFP